MCTFSHYSRFIIFTSIFPDKGSRNDYIIKSVSMTSSKLKVDPFKAEKEEAYQKFLQNLRNRKYSCLNCTKYDNCKKWEKLRSIISSKPANQLRISETAEERRRELWEWTLERAKALSAVRKCIYVRERLQKKGYRMFYYYTIRLENFVTNHQYIIT